MRETAAHGHAMRIVHLGGFATAIAAFVACAAASVAPESSAAQRILWSSCYETAKELECARVAVPLDWQRPDGDKIELAVIRHRAGRPRERIGSLFFNWGGPGVAGVGELEDHLAADVDIVAARTRIGQRHGVERLVRRQHCLARSNRRGRQPGRCGCACR